MKKTISMTLILLILLSLVSLNNSSFAAGEKITAKHESLNLRESIQGDIISSITNEEVCEVMGNGEGSDGELWYKVLHKGRMLWALASDAKIVSSGYEVEGIVKVTYQYGANVRKTPWGTVLGQLGEGEEFETRFKKNSGNGDYWYRIDYNGQEAYISETVVEFIEKDLSGPVGEPQSSVGKVTINYSAVNIRTEPWGDVIRVAYNGESFSSIEKLTHTDGSQWYKIKVGETFGYVHKDFVNFKPEEESQDDDNPQIAGKLSIDYEYGLNVRLSPWGEIIGLAADKEEYDYFEIISDDDGTKWCKIKYKGRIAYVYKPFVKIKGEHVVEEVDLVFSSSRFTGDRLEIFVSAEGTDNYHSKVSLKNENGNLVGLGNPDEWNDSNVFYWQPPKSGNYEFVVYVKDVNSSKVQSTSTHKVKIESGVSANTYEVEYFGMTLNEFAEEESGARSQTWHGGWTDATKAEIYNAANPENSVPFEYNDGSSKRDKAFIMNTVNFRKTPGGELIEVLSYGEEYVVYDYKKQGGYTYYKLNVDGKYGWIRGDFADLKTEKSEQMPLGSFIKMTSTNYVKKGPNSGSANVGVVDEDEICFLLDTDGPWAKIQTTNLKGWVLRSKLVLTDQVSQEMYQFLDLSKSTQASESEINKVLVGKGILEGKGQAFIDAAQKYDVNELYLVSHALLETGGGTSLLATGDYYNGVKVYNMYGVGAYDSNPIGGGLSTAYNNGWTTPEKAIIGGAEYIGEQYIHNNDDQKTLYRMKWNYEDPSHQYATDIGWAKKQTQKIKDLYSKIQNYVLHFIIPQFSNQ